MVVGLIGVFANAAVRWQLSKSSYPIEESTEPVALQFCDVIVSLTACLFEVLNSCRECYSTGKKQKCEKSEGIEDKADDTRIHNLV